MKIICSYLSYFINILILLAYNWFVVMCYFQVNRLIQLYIHTSVLFWILLLTLYFLEPFWFTGIFRRRYRYFLYSPHTCLKVLVTQLCPTLCDPMDYSLPGLSVSGILQARILEWVAIPFSKGPSRPRGRTWVSCAAVRFFNCLSHQGSRYTCLPIFIFNDLRHSGQLVQSLSRVRHCDPMNRSTPGLPVHRQLPESTQTYVHRAGDAVQPSHPLSSPSPPASSPSQHQDLFQWVNSLHEGAKV